jgi:gliding motility-associated-like protein
MLFLFLIFQKGLTQDALQNFGNLRIHENGLVGFHINLINNGPFDQNLGLAGFYGDDALEISGTAPILFHDFEIFAEKGVYLSNALEVTNNLSFIEGNLMTEKNTSDHTVGFMDNAFHIGASNSSHINGYASMVNKELFTFPVGDGTRLRGLTLASSQTNTRAECAYFHEDPNNPLSVNGQFNTDSKENEDLEISDVEFWIVEGEHPSTVTINWTPDSFLSLVSDDAQKLRIVGWSKSTEQWEDLGNSAVTGNLETGSITSDIFIPNHYALVTLGGSDNVLETFAIASQNYLLTPNNDGANDFLKIADIEKSPNNILNIYNRNGILVYSKINYRNEFDGISNVNSVFRRNKGLPSGVYFYILTLKDTGSKINGYLYIAR